MKLCIVGQGPSAKGRGREIDACDFVVRMKAFWLHGAENAGEKISAWAWFGDKEWPGDAVGPSSQCEHWLTHCKVQIATALKVGQKRVQRAKEAAGRAGYRQLSDRLWTRARVHLDRHPSTGFIAVCMGMDRFHRPDLVLYGFDSTGPQRPNYWDARRPPEPDCKHHHHVLAEKRAIAEIRNGMWLGAPTTATLTWPDMPDIGIARA